MTRSQMIETVARKTGLPREPGGDDDGRYV